MDAPGARGGDSERRGASLYARIAIIVVASAVLLSYSSSEQKAGSVTARAATPGHSLTVELYLSGLTSSSGNPSLGCRLGERAHPGSAAIAVEIVSSRGTVVTGLMRRDPEERECSFRTSLFVSDAPRYAVSISEVGTLSYTRDQLERNAWGVTLAMGGS
jgi:hypothetical protein